MQSIQSRHKKNKLYLAFTSILTAASGAALAQESDG